MTLPLLDVLSVKIPVSDLAVSRPWYAEVFGLRTEMEWPDDDGVVRGVGLTGLGRVVLGLREHQEAAAASDRFGFLNVRVPDEADLDGCAAPPRRARALVLRADGAGGRARRRPPPRPRRGHRAITRIGGVARPGGAP